MNVQYTPLMRILLIFSFSKSHLHSHKLKVSKKIQLSVDKENYLFIYLFVVYNQSLFYLYHEKILIFELMQIYYNLILKFLYILLFDMLNYVLCLYIIHNYYKIWLFVYI